ncbi:MAG: hypothetical protein WD688_18820 [Candidatus Binatia bacterium]
MAVVATVLIGVRTQRRSLTGRSGVIAIIRISDFLLVGMQMRETFRFTATMKRNQKSGYKNQN